MLGSVVSAEVPLVVLLLMGETAVTVSPPPTHHRVYQYTDTTPHTTHDWYYVSLYM